MSFQFLDPGPLIDGELELVTPDVKWVEAYLAACEHPLSADDPTAQRIDRRRLMDFLQACPGGRQPGDPARGRVPCYHFWMHILPGADSPVQIAGSIGLRIGNNYDLETYIGHIGYNVFPPARGHHYAERSCRLLLNLARAHGMRRLWITCNPDNWASRKTCLNLGCKLAEIVVIPPTHSLYQRGEREKCRYWLDL